MRKIKSLFIIGMVFFGGEALAADPAVPAIGNSPYNTPTLPTLNPTINPNSPDTGGAGDLMVAPTRIVIQGRDKAAEILLNNRGSKEATYRISFIHIQMGDDGAYKEISDEQAKQSGVFADDILRFSPHQVTLKPGETQVVKVMASSSEGLRDGEYRSHMLFRAVPDASVGSDVEGSKAINGQISINVIPVYGVSIPIIVRRGELSAQSKLTDVKISGNSLSLTITRSGTKSVYGDIKVTQGDTVVGQAYGIAVLVPNTKRNITIPLSANTGGALTVEYREHADEGGKVIDTASVR